MDSSKMPIEKMRIKVDATPKHAHHEVEALPVFAKRRMTHEVSRQIDLKAIPDAVRIPN